MMRLRPRYRSRSIEPDAVHTDMWRVRRMDGTLTDMVNLTRAKDAAMAIALAELNAQETPAAAA
jgi:hypothetical protein